MHYVIHFFMDLFLCVMITEIIYKLAGFYARYLCCANYYTHVLFKTCTSTLARTHTHNWTLRNAPATVVYRLKKVGGSVESLD